LTVTFEIDYPERLDELDTSRYGEPISIDFDNNTYEFKTVLTTDCTTFHVIFQVDNQTSELSTDVKQRLANKAIEVINRCISRIRTFYHDKTNFLLVSPRLIRQAKVTTSFDEKINIETLDIQQLMPPYLKEFFDFLNEEEGYLSLSEKLEIDQVIFLHLIIDAYYSLYDSKYNECVINCATAIESYIFPLLKEWFTEKLFNKNEKNAETILMDIPSALKLELLFGSVKSEYLKLQSNLLENMKSINKLRNSIIHSGKTASKKDAEFALGVFQNYIVIMPRF
jgi:hypothetical protein